MTDRISLQRDGATLRVVERDVDRYKQLGWAEVKPKRKPAAKRPTKPVDEGDE